MKTAGVKQFVRPDLQAHIYADALLANLTRLKSLCARSVKFCAVVKAGAYGHGIIEVVDILKDSGVDFFAVASVFEALYIASHLNGQSVLILEPIHAGQSPEIISLCAENKFHCVVSSVQAVEYVSSVLADTGLSLDLHLNIETGMQRCGIEPPAAQQLIQSLGQSRNLRLAGVYTHFATADEEDLSFACEQLAIFNDFLTSTGLDRDKRPPPRLASGDAGAGVLVHAANSAATIKMPQAHFDMVRCGIALYGYFSRRQTNTPINLVPVMKLQAPVAHLRAIPKGRSVSYGRSFTAKRDTLAAVIPIGYADGYSRCFSNRAKMKLRNTAVPVIGRVCMDQVLIDVTDVPGVRIGEMVTVIDNQHDSACSVYALADLADTICYEILAGVGPHVNRLVHW